MMELAIPGPKPASRLFSRLKAFYVGSVAGELSARPPGMQALGIFLLAETRAGAVAPMSIETDWRQKLLPVLFKEASLWRCIGVGVARGDT